MSTVSTAHVRGQVCGGGYLNIEEGHALFGLGVVPSHPVDSLWDEVKDKVQVELILYLQRGGRVKDHMAMAADALKHHAKLKPTVTQLNLTP